MLNVGRIEEGFVLDHIKAGKAMTIYPVSYTHLFSQYQTDYF